MLPQQDDLFHVERNLVGRHRAGPHVLLVELLAIFHVGVADHHSMLTCRGHVGETQRLFGGGLKDDSRCISLWADATNPSSRNRHEVLFRETGNTSGPQPAVVVASQCLAIRPDPFDLEGMVADVIADRDWFVRDVFQTETHFEVGRFIRRFLFHDFGAGD